MYFPFAFYQFEEEERTSLYFHLYLTKRRNSRGGQQAFLRKEIGDKALFSLNLLNRSASVLINQ